LFQVIRRGNSPEEELPPLSFHGLRHCAASLMLASGADISVVSKLYTYDHQLGLAHPHPDGARPESIRTRARRLQALQPTAVLSAPASHDCRPAAIR
jgi:integrase